MNQPDNNHTQIYYWPRNFLVRSNSFKQEFRDKPYQRLSATIVANPTADFSLQAGHDAPITSRLSILSPGSRRQYLEFNGGDGFLLDIDITSDLFSRLKPILPMHGSMEPGPDITTPVLDNLSRWSGKPLTTSDAVSIFHDSISLLAPEPRKQRPRDSRVTEVLRIIDHSARDEITVAGLADAVGLSESRLRSLVQRELGCNLARYLKWATAWKTAALWRPGITYTEVAHAAGFHDLSHANRTFIELFGMSPTRVLRSNLITLHRCSPGN